MYNKIFTKILDSSIWLENQPTRIVWITFLACMDQDGVVALSGIGNVANRARVSFEEATDAIHCLESPDTHNPDQDHEGRRIERIPGVGWIVINAEKYRDIVKAEEGRAKTRERVARHRDNKKTEASSNAPVTPSNDLSQNVAPSEAEADSISEGEEEECAPEKEIKNGSGENVRAAFDNWREITGHDSVFLSPTLKKLLKARLDEGFTVDQLATAARGAKLSPHHVGINDNGQVYDSIDLIYRNDATVWRFIGYATDVPERRDTRGAGAQPATETPRAPLTTDQAKGHALAYKLHLDIDERNATREAALDDKIKNAWVDVLGDMEAVLNRDAFNTWFKPLRLIDVQATSPVILAGSITCDWVRTYYRDAFGRALADHGFGVIVWQDTEYANAEDFKAHFPDDHWQEIEKHL